EAREREVLSIRMELLGGDHPQTIRALVDLANTFCKQGQVLKASKLLHGSLNDFRASTFKATEFCDLMTMWEFGLCTAHILTSNYESDKAEEILETCYASSVRSYGENHTSSIDIQLNIVDLYVDRGRLLQAERTLLKIQKLCQFRLGPGTPYTTKVQHKLASVYLEQGRLLEAEELLSNLLACRNKILG
ncbi:11817_t:CDS:1, partial [Acaulospora colombiana]